MFIFLPLFVIADLDSDLEQAISLNNIVNELLKVTQDTHLSHFQDQLVYLEKEVERAENSLKQLEDTIVNLADHHAHFNDTEAKEIRSLIDSLEGFVNNLDIKVRNIDYSAVRNSIPKAIVGQATKDFQAFHSVEKIKQESLKIDSTIASNSKFLWIWGLLTGLVLLSSYIVWKINRVSKANL